MTRFDFSPLFRSTVGFDRMMNLLESAGNVGEDGYPPYNIEKVSQDAYRISMAVAGFGEDDLNVEAKENTLVVTGKIAQEKDEGRSYLYRGIAGRSFKRSFQLADHVKVKGATLENGLLHVDLAREIPEEMKPRTIEIGKSSTKQLKAEKAAA